MDEKDQRRSISSHPSSGNDLRSRRLHPRTGRGYTISCPKSLASRQVSKKQAEEVTVTSITISFALRAQRFCALKSAGLIDIGGV